MDEKELYEEYNTLPAFWGWVVLVVFAAMIIGSAFLMHHNIKDRPREWFFGQLPHAPAESIYSTVEPPPDQPVPPQIHALPEAKPLPNQTGGGP